MKNAGFARKIIRLKNVQQKLIGEKNIIKKKLH
jgi:hypothetical protein